jgi:hypothetical protein
MPLRFVLVCKDMWSDDVSHELINTPRMPCLYIRSRYRISVFTILSLNYLMEVFETIKYFVLVLHQVQSCGTCTTIDESHKKSVHQSPLLNKVPIYLSVSNQRHDHSYFLNLHTNSLYASPNSHPSHTSFCLSAFSYFNEYKHFRRLKEEYPIRR